MKTGEEGRKEERRGDKIRDRREEIGEGKRDEKREKN